MHHWLLVAVLLARLRLATLVSQNDTDLASSRMSEMLQMPVPYPSARLHHQLKPHPMADLMQLQLGNRPAGEWPQRTHPVPYNHYPPQLASPIVPLAVSFSIGYLLFRLLALGVVLLEKEFSLPYGHWKTLDTKLDPMHFGRGALNNNALMHLMERVHKALDFYAKHKHWK